MRVGDDRRTLFRPDGAATVIHDFGGDGPVLLFVHATGMHGWVWKPVIDHLIDRAHCFALDLRGHGDSLLLPESDLSWTAFGGDVLSAAQNLGDRKVIGVGHSLGGAALLVAELEAPGTFDRLFLYEPAVHTETSGREWETLLTARDFMVDMTRRRRATFATRADALANYVSKPPMAEFQAAVLGAYVARGFNDSNEGPETNVVLKCLPDTEARIYAASYDHNTATRLHEITCPVTLATGSETDPLQRRTVEALAARFGTEPVVLPGVDHFGPMQQPKQFADAVARHLLVE